MRRALCAAIAAAIAFLAPLAAGAQSPPPSARVTVAPITLDGRLDEPDWALADSITDFRQKEPVEGGTPSERTVVRLLATPAGLAVGWWLYDRTPEGIVRTQLRRDAALRSDDYVSLMIDGLRDKRSAFYFRTNSNGAMWDGEHINAETGNEEWDGIWDVRTRITNEGWTAEMLIPWATLRYRDDATAFGMNFRRFLPRTNEELLWRAWRRMEGFRFLEQEGTVGGFTALPPRTRFELRPFVLAEGRAPERAYAPDGSSTELRRAASDLAVGLDVKVPVTATLTADITTFPDFAQAEADRQVVNLTRFPLFFPEQRTFFTEGASIFGFGRREQTQLFYSRRIGRGEAGTPVEIPVGARMQGRVGRTQLGLLAVRTGEGEEATDLVARVRRDILGRGFMGVMATYSDRPLRRGSFAGGVDAELPFILGARRDNLVVSANAAWNRDAGTPAGGHYRALVDYPNDHADIVMRFDRVEHGYQPALGFVQQVGIHRWGGSTRITPRPRNARLIRRWEFDLLTYDVVWDLDGTLDNASFSARPLGATFQSGDRVEVNLIRRFDGPRMPFELVPGTTVDPGEYWWERAEVRYVGANVRAWSLQAGASRGRFYDGDRTDLSLTGLLRVQPHVEVRLEYERNDVTLPQGAFVANTVRFRGDYAFSPRLTATLFAQSDDQSDRLALNTRLRWTTSPGSDLYAVWTSAWPTGLERRPAVDRPLNGALVVKYVRFLRR
jgi:hypothetical protein